MCIVRIIVTYVLNLRSILVCKRRFWCKRRRDCVSNQSIGANSPSRIWRSHRCQDLVCGKISVGQIHQRITFDSYTHELEWNQARSMPSNIERTRRIYKKNQKIKKIGIFPMRGLA